MKIFAFTDTHTDEEVLSELDSKVQDADLLVCTGDIAWYGSGAEDMIKHFDTWNKQVFLIHGNHEFDEEVSNACKKTKNVRFMHNKIAVKENVMFIGWGGDWYLQESPNFENFIKANESTIKSHKGKLVLMVHMPPYNTKTDFIFGAHRGNKSYRKFIEEYKPALVLCGHFHETFRFTDKIGETLIINTGQEGEYFDL